MKIVLHKMIDVTMAAGVISREGCVEINIFMRKLGIPKLPDWWDWHTKVAGKGEYVGSFPKRVAKYYYQTIRYKMSSDNLGILGSIMSQHTNRDNRYRFDFTDCFDWEAGNFGDDDSCFWTDNAGAREALQAYGAYAIRFYDRDNGYARAWICRENDYYVVFNGYGLETAHIARIMSDYMGLSYRKVTLDNYGETGGLIWINGGAGYVVGSESSVNNLSRVSLEIEGGGTYCDCCHCLINEDDHFCIDGVGELCGECFCNNYSICNDCHECYPNDECCEVAGQYGNEYVCGSCLGHNYTKCEDCNKYYADDSILSIDDRNVCQSCFEDGEYYTCDGVGELCGECFFDV